MNERSLSVEEFNELLQKWSGQTIRIIKHELDDLDRVVMELKDISYSTNTRRSDQYEAMHTLLLNGTGVTETVASNTQPLPDSTYEIPLEDSTLYQFDNQRFSLLTDRGTYTIEVASENYLP
ncbi:hypothetical protein [Halobacillus campisalis]|uniref:Uncharacterized protein n=1 Tax=Halobacillus campisalis TaxID=435909 RepID=A0ABW2K0J5_9BACI|nr:hypothetical protein [Halobacillus campisalis]